MVDKRIEEWMEVKTMADEALLHLISPELRSNLLSLLRDPKMLAIQRHIDAQMYLDGDSAFEAEDWKRAIDIWTKLVNSPSITPDFAQFFPDIYSKLYEAWIQNKDDDALIASELKKYLQKVKTDDPKWGLYVVHQLNSFDNDIRGNIYSHLVLTNFVNLI